MVFGRDGLLRVRVEYEQVRVGAWSDDPLPGVYSEDTGRVLRQDAGHPRQGESPLCYTLAVDQGDECFDGRRPERYGGAVIGDVDVLAAFLLQVLGAGGVVAAYVGDVALHRALPHGLLVDPVRGTERRDLS